MGTQKIALFGATSKVGQGILNEALSRGHRVTVFVRDPKKIPTSHSNLKVVKGDVFDFTKNDITAHLKGHNVVISGYETMRNPKDHVIGTRTLIEGVKGADVPHFIAFGHPGTDEREPGAAIPGNPEGWKAVAKAQREAIDALKKEKTFHWGYAHYPEITDEFGKSGKPALGNEMTLITPEGDHKIPFGNSAARVLDEAEHLMEEHTDRE
ncbi:MAG TPA: NAD(P)H-binding protein [Bacteroidia bacterium]|jgi:putative NADH-flavin reductase|nr:NAD(P)H-binding protein [Bacteroidia bacterium]